MARVIAKLVVGVAVCAGVSAGAVVVGQRDGRPEAIEPQVICADRESVDQDDMCFWVHPKDPSKSIVIAADKKADRLFVYDLEGRTLQSVTVEHPGNVDVRYGFVLGKRTVDIVALNQRHDFKVFVFTVDADTRRLERVDDGNIGAGENYGGTLYRSPRSGRFYFFTTSKAGDVVQYKLTDNGSGKVTGEQVRSWKIRKSEAAVADDERGKVYIGEEDKGVWEVGGEPDDPAPGKLVVRVGENGLAGDVEGLAIYHRTGGEGYLIVSDQGVSEFKVYRRGGSHEPIGRFSIRGAEMTDGIDVCNAGLGPRFPKGLFACHTAEGRCAVLLTSWEAIAQAVRPQLAIDTSWTPRR